MMDLQRCGTMSQWVGAVGVLAMLSACGGSGDSSTPALSAAEPVALAAQSSPQASTDLALLAAPQPQLLALAAAEPAALAALTPDPGVLLLLLPDGQDMSDARVRAWLDAASEEGVRIQPVTDAAFLSMGVNALSYAGLILPDSLHVLASDGLVSAIQSYTAAGGKTMLVFDFGALTLAGDVPVYPIPQSRLSGMAGVDYVLYDQLRDKTVGLGPVTALRSQLRALMVPPGKSMAFAGLPASGVQSLSTSTSTTSSTSEVASSTSVGTSVLLTAGGVSTQSALYLPVSTADPGGARGFDPQQYASVTYASSASVPSAPAAQRAPRIDLGRAVKASPLGTVTVASPTTSATTSATTLGTAAALVNDPLESYSGYLLGPLIYPSYVTQGTFGTLAGQQTLATSPQFGLVAGLNPVGAGQVLFVNLPLTYLKGRTDALMMHGFLHYFSRQVVGMAHLSPMPNGVGGMTLNWHLDSMAAQAPTQQLVKLNVFNDPTALFSVDMTAGPDAILPGDRLGWNLSGNKTARQLLKSLDSQGHSVGSHGGWIHDYFGFNATESNQLSSTGGACVNPLTRTDNYLQCLVLNRQAVDAVTGKVGRSYSAPEGNNPLWAMSWLEQQGVVATYFAGHTGLGATRQYREGQLLNPGLWVFPVTPQGLYATFEEFQAYGVPQTDVLDWYKSLVDFGVAQNTSRLIYAHPPGAALWSTVLTDMLAYAKARSPRFAWYTMPRLADFMTRRLSVSWSQSKDAATGLTVFTASHPVSLKEMVWRLPRTAYPNAPRIVSGKAVVDGTDPQFWQVKAGAGTQLVFRA
jgi:hypothetical protein